jgi:CRP-like cAMP-binding protein/NAD-dependent dihydropyrimidine dehydrogenase PreA subunit
MSMFDFVPIDELRTNPLLRGLPYKFLEFNDRTVVRRRYERGKVVCREGEFGSTAWLIIRGRLAVEAAGNPEPILLDENDRIVGEMACLSHRRRTATIRAYDDGVELWEIRRTFLDMLRRFRGSRAELDRLYLERALANSLSRTELLDGDLGPDLALSDAERSALIDDLRRSARCRLADPGQLIVQQGEPAREVFFIRLGNVKVTHRPPSGGPEAVVDSLGPGQSFGEVALLSTLDPAELGLALNPIAERLPPGYDPGVRTTSCTALDNVELVIFPAEAFYKVLRKYPRFRERAVRLALRRVDDAPRQPAAGLDEFLDQGLFHAQKLLALDLTKCTRCDECTKACDNSHLDIARLVREGRRFGHYLIASSCRSCEDPYCVVGCPVDSIHRRPSADGLDRLAVYIEDWCIGCGLCEKNCPYGSITMVERPNPRAGQPGVRATIRRATNCDLCEPIGALRGGEPMCVHACPHDAAHRMTGAELRAAVLAMT